MLFLDILLKHFSEMLYCSALVEYFSKTVVPGKREKMAEFIIKALPEDFVVEEMLDIASYIKKPYEAESSESHTKARNILQQCSCNKIDDKYKIITNEKEKRAERDAKSSHISKKIPKMQSKGHCSYSYYVLEKRLIGTIQAIQAVAKKLGINPKLINYAGLKDKAAVTRQYVSIRNGPEHSFTASNKEIKIKLAYIGSGDERLSIGCNKGNCFKITIRKLKRETAEAIYRAISGLKDKELIFLNLFGTQRFGISNKNHLIGRTIVKGRFSEAIGLLNAEPESTKAEWLKKLNMHLEKFPNDFVGAFKKMPKQLAKVFVHSFQSKLWNSCVLELMQKKEIKPVLSVRFHNSLINDAINKQDSPERICQNKLIPESFPLPGFNTNLESYPKFVQELLIKGLEDVKLSDFLIRQWPEISAEGEDRAILAKASEISAYSYKEDILNSGFFAIGLSFCLPKGSYASEVIRQLLEAF